MNGQRVTSAVASIHRNLGLYNYCYHKAEGCDSDCLHLSDSDNYISAHYNTLNYSDDLGGVEETLERATLSFITLGSLLSELGLAEALDKAVSPCQIMTYLGIEFHSCSLEMRINMSKCQELKFELQKWSKKIVAFKFDLQSILG